MDAAEAAATPKRRQSSVARVATRIASVGALLSGGVVAGLPVTVGAAPAAMAALPADGAAALNAREHVATVEYAEAASAQREALRAAAKPQRAAWAERLEVIAHRGGTAWGPESTLATFRHAIDVGSDAIELDVRFTRDGVPVVLHDDTLDRTTNCRGPVANLTLRQLKRCDAGSWYRPNPRPGERVPTLDDALALIRRSPAEVYIHVKVADSAQARRLVHTVRQNEMDTGRTTYLSDWHHVLAHLRGAGAQRLGYVFHSASEWGSDYDVLVPQDLDVRRSDVAKAQKRGAYVIAVEGTPVRPAQLDDLGLDGFMANDLEDVLDRVDRVPDAGSGPGRPDRDPDRDRDGDGEDGRDGSGEDGRDGRDGDDWDPNNWDDDDDWDPSGPDGPWGPDWRRER